VWLLKTFASDCVVNYGYLLVGNAGLSNFFSLPVRDANDSIHVPNNSTVEPLVEPHLAAFGRPTTRHGDDRDTKLAGRPKADEVGLVAVAAKDVSSDFHQVLLEFSRRGDEMGRVASKRMGVKAAFASLIEEDPAIAALGEGDECCLDVGVYLFGQFEYLPLWPTEKAGGSQLDNVQISVRILRPALLPVGRVIEFTRRG